MEFHLTPRLIVRGAAQALEFYRQALGARIIERYADEKLGGLIVHSAIEVGEQTIAVIDEHLDWGHRSPLALGGSAVLLHATVEDPDGLADRMAQHGAEIVIPIADQFYGRREGRVKDPFGHLWILGKDIETLDPEEIQRRVDAYGA